jgi:AcrR family transcriptional regulator
MRQIMRRDALDTNVIQMSGSKATKQSSNGKGAKPFQAPATIRQPAGAFGPRAQRTIALIIDATREVLLTRGYAGTSIDEIARLADVSRASFYTYFPSKREVLLAVGAHSASETSELITRLPELGTTRGGMAAFTTLYFELLDRHGSFAFAWTQAAQEDAEIRSAGMRRHLRLCKEFGVALAGTTGKPVDDPALLGLTITAMLERSWSYLQLYAERLDREQMIGRAAQTMWSTARQPALRVSAS